MHEPPPLWLRVLSFKPVLCLAAGVLIPIALVWLVVLGTLVLLGQVIPPAARAAKALSTGLFDAARGWFEELRQRYGDGT